MTTAIQNNRPAIFLLAILWVIGLIMVIPERDNFALLPLYGICTIITVLGALFAIERSAAPFQRKNPLILSMIAFWIWAALSLLWSQTIMSSILTLTMLSLFPATFLILTRNTPSIVDFLKIAFWGFFFVAILLSISALLQFYIFTDFLRGGKVTWPFANSNAYAALLSLCVFPSLSLTILTKGLRQPIMGCATFILFAGIFILAGRAAFLCLILGLVLYGFFFAKTLIQSKRTIGILVIAIIIFIALHQFGFSEHDDHKDPIDRLVTIEDYTQDGSLSDRIKIWGSAFDMIADRPIAGSAIGSFRFFYPEYQTPLETTVKAVTAHSTPIQFGVELGIIGILLFYAILLSALFHMGRVMGAVMHDPEKKQSVAWIICATSFCSLSAFILHTHFSAHFQAIPLVVASSFFLAIWYLASDRLLNAKKAKESHSGNTILRWAISLIVCIPVLFIFIRLDLSQLQLYKTEQLLPETLGQRINTAHNLSFGFNPHAYLMAASFPMAEIQFAQNPDKRQSLYDQAVAHLDNAKRVNPRLPQIYLLKGRLEATVGNTNKAEDYYKQALIIEPRTYQARFALFSLLEQSERVAEGLDILRNGLKWRYNNADTAINRIQALQIFEQYGAENDIENTINQMVKDRP